MTDTIDELRDTADELIRLLIRESEKVKELINVLRMMENEYNPNGLEQTPAALEASRLLRKIMP